MLIGALLPVEAQQQMLTLDSCRAMALRNNKQLNIARLKQDVARNARKAMRTKYLPKVDAIGGYELFSKEISLLNDRQKNALGKLGTTVAGNIGTNLNSIITNMVQQGIITPQVGQQMGTNWAKPLTMHSAPTPDRYGLEPCCFANRSTWEAPLSPPTRLPTSPNKWLQTT